MRDGDGRQVQKGEVEVNAGDYAGRDYVGQDRVEGDKFTGDKIVGHSEPEYTVGVRKPEATRKNATAGFFDLLSNSLAIDISGLITLKNAGIAAGVWLVTRLGAFFDLVAPAVPGLVLLISLAVIALYGVFVFYRGDFSCPNCGSEYALRVRWRSVVDSERLIKQYSCARDRCGYLYEEDYIEQQK